MKFGKLEDITQVDFALPDDHALNDEFMGKKKVAPYSKLYTGATSWNNDKWRGVLFPEKTKKSNFLQVYSRQFNSIELNATHYRTPSDKTMATWISETPEDFRFCPKILQAISHRKDMVTNKELLNTFIVQLAKLEHKLGCVFLQLPPYFKYENLPYLEKFLALWPEEIPLAVEVRDSTLHSDGKQFEAYAHLLFKYKTYPVITDVSGRRDLMHMLLTGEKVFVRWVGNGLHPTDFERVKEWAERLNKWTQEGVKEIFFMLHEPENEKTPEIASYIAKELKNNQYIGLRGPKLVEKAPNLFSTI